MRILLLAAAACVVAAAPARAQSQDDITLPAVQAPASDQQKLSLARALVARTASSDIKALPWLGMPMGAFMQQWHITPREHAQIIFRDALVPVLQKHIAAFQEIEAGSYAAELSLDDLQAIGKFYDSPAGLAMLRMQGPLVKLNTAGLQQMLEKMKPEMQGKIDEALKAHGWSKG